jgi:hypothetical protein
VSWRSPSREFKHRECLAILLGGGNSIDSHALLETFSTLPSGKLGIRVTHPHSQHGRLPAYADWEFFFYLCSMDLVEEELSPVGVWVEIG